MSNVVTSYGGVPVFGVEACDGWVLHSFPEDDGDGFTTTAFYAARGVEERLLQHSRWRFTPSQRNFDFLAGRGFPRAPGGGPWDDASIEAAIAALDGGVPVSPETESPA